MKKNINENKNGINFNKYSILYKEQKDKYTKVKNLTIIILMILILLSVLFIYVLIYLKPKEEFKKFNEDLIKKLNKSCEKGFYLNISLIEKKSECIKCSIENCELCNYTKRINKDTCFSCFSHFNPKYKYNTITSCK